MLPSMPALDANVCGDWTENQIGVYQTLPFWFAKLQVDTKQRYSTFSKLTKKRMWKPNNGPTLRGVRTHASPNLRQFINPNPLSTSPKTDVMDIRESITEAQLTWQDFESPIFNFYPDFNDFMSHIDDNGKDISEKIEIANEIYIRGMMFHMSPHVFVCQADGSIQTVASPFFSGSGTFDGGVNQGKTAAFLIANLPTGPLQLSCIEQAMTHAETYYNIPYFTGSDLPKDDQPLDGKFLIVQDPESWNRLIYDPLVKANRSINFDMLNNGYRGSIFGRAVSKLESFPLRYTNLGTFKAPEVRTDAGEVDGGQTIINTEYGDPKQSQYVVNWLIGKNGYETIETGNPPALFTGNSFPNAPRMNWDGVPVLTKQILLQCVDSNGVVQYKMNSRGRYLKFEATSTFGVLATQRRNAIPILSMRKQGPGNP